MKIIPEQHPSIEAARAMYARYVTGWVLDLARLRHKCLERPTGRRSHQPVGRPGTRAEGTVLRRAA